MSPILRRLLTEGLRESDVVEFEADERVQHVVLASPSAGMQAPDGGHRQGQAVAAQSDSAGRSGQAGSYA
jgi:hypothetical protein